MVLQLEQIPEGAVAINDGIDVKENREASETGSCQTFIDVASITETTI